MSLSPDLGVADSRPAGRIAPLGSPRLERGSAESLLEHYLADIRHIRVLAPQEEVEFSRRILAGEAGLRNEVMAIPYAARQLLARWEEIHRAGRVTATLSTTRRPDGALDRSAEIDALFGRIREALERRDRLTGRAGFEPARPTASVAHLDRCLAEWVREVNPRTDLLFGIYLELKRRDVEMADWRRSQRRASAPRRPALAERVRAAEIEVGLAASELQKRLETAAEVLQDLGEARELFVFHNLRLVVSVAKEFRNMGVPFLDLIQEGNTGLVRAVEKFDYRQGCRFSTYGVWWIRQSCIRAIQNTSRTVRLPTNLHDRLLRYRRAVASLAVDQDAADGLAAVARALGVSQREVDVLVEYDRRPLSLEEPVSGADSLDVGERLEDFRVRAPEELLDGALLDLQIPALLEGLPERERRVLEWRFGLAGAEERTLQDIGDQLGLSRERVRQIERGALGKLREEAERRGLETLAR